MMSHEQCGPLFGDRIPLALVRGPFSGENIFSRGVCKVYFMMMS